MKTPQILVLISLLILSVALLIKAQGYEMESAPLIALSIGLTAYLYRTKTNALKERTQDI